MLTLARPTSKVDEDIFSKWADQDLLKVYVCVCGLGGGFEDKNDDIFSKWEDDDIWEDIFSNWESEDIGEDIFQGEDMGEDIFSKYVDADCTYAY